MNVTFEPNLWGEGKGDCFFLFIIICRKQILVKQRKHARIPVPQRP